MFVVCRRLCTVPVAVKLFNPGVMVLRVDVDTRLSHNRSSLVVFVLSNVLTLCVIMLQLYSTQIVDVNTSVL